MLAFADTDGVCGFAASLVRGCHRGLVWRGQASRGDTHWDMAYYGDAMETSPEVKDFCLQNQFVKQ